MKDEQEPSERITKVVHINPPRVHVGLAFKKNLGNYESLGVDLGIEDSVRYAKGETTDQCVDRIYDYLEPKFISLVEKAVEGLDD